MRKLLGVPDVSIGVIYQVAVTNDAMSDGNSRCVHLRSPKLKYSLFMRVFFSQAVASSGSVNTRI